MLQMYALGEMHLGDINSGGINSGDTNPGEIEGFRCDPLSEIHFEDINFSQMQFNRDLSRSERRDLHVENSQVPPLIDIPFADEDLAPS